MEICRLPSEARGEVDRRLSCLLNSLVVLTLSIRSNDAIELQLYCRDVDMIGSEFILCTPRMRIRVKRCCMNLEAEHIVPKPLQITLERFGDVWATIMNDNNIIVTGASPVTPKDKIDIGAFEDDIDGTGENVLYYATDNYYTS